VLLSSISETSRPCLYVLLVRFFFFFFLLRPPPNSPLFPYTPLFRSYFAVAGSGWNRYKPSGALASSSAGNKFTLRSGVFPNTPEDRKSTRLNSSHRTISYAVFCLKKKKNKHQLIAGGDHRIPVHQLL